MNEGVGLRVAAPQLIIRSPAEWSDAERQAAGRIDWSSGRIDPAKLGNPRVDDVLDDLGTLVEKMAPIV